MKLRFSGKILLVFSLLLSLLLFAGCGETPPDDPPEHTVCVDADGDGFCDECGEKMPAPVPKLSIVEGFETAYNIILENSLSYELKQKVFGYLDALKEEGVVFTRIDDYRTDKMTEKEILVGNVAHREACRIDPHSLGENGYAVRVVGERIVLAGGSDRALADAIDAFFVDLMEVRMTEDGDLSIAVDYDDSHPQTEYPLDGITIAGEDVANFTIVPANDDLSRAEANYLRDTVYNLVGAWVPTGEERETHNIFIRLVNDAGEEGFRIFEKDGNLTVECAYKNAFDKALRTFVNLTLRGHGGTMEFNTGYHYTDNVAVVTYEQFGAKGDGMTDDFEAIVAAHAYANEGGQLVRAGDNATYYIKKGGLEAIVQTDVEWGTAKFIIDDTAMTPADMPYAIFRIRPNYGTITVPLSSDYAIPKGATNIGMTFSNEMVVFIQSSKHKVYAKYPRSGTAYGQLDYLLVDRDGNIEDGYQPLFDYSDGVTKMTAMRTDETPITLHGGVFTTICNRLPYDLADVYRNIQIERSNVTVDGVTHYLVDEPENPATSSWDARYAGFYRVEGAYHVVISNCMLTGHKSIQGGANYETCCGHSVDVLWYNCRQTNAIDDNSQWGCMASSESRKLVYDHCYLSRYDSHRGHVDGAILNSEIGQLVNLIGGGEFLIDNCIFRCSAHSSIITLRTDAGVCWDGDITIRNSTINSKSKTIYILRGIWNDFDHGQECHMGRTVTIDNLSFPEDTTVYFANDYVGSKANGGFPTDISLHPTHPYYMPEKIVVQNCENPLYLAPTSLMRGFFLHTDYDPEAFADTKTKQ